MSSFHIVFIVILIASSAQKVNFLCISGNLTDHETKFTLAGKRHVVPDVWKRTSS